MQEILSNPIVLSVFGVLILSLIRVNVVLALTSSAIFGGIFSGMSLKETISFFEQGLGNGGLIAFSYATLGSFALALEKTGVTNAFVHKIILQINHPHSLLSHTKLKYLIFFILTLIAISSQNLVPIHIAFIPILIPPLLSIFNTLQIDRRVIACILTFGLVTPYMLLPVGFGGIFLNDILLRNLQTNGLDIAAEQIIQAMILPATGMVIGLFIAIFISYKKPRNYKISKQQKMQNDKANIGINKKNILVAIVGMQVALATQLYTDSMIVGAISGFSVLALGNVIGKDNINDVFSKGLHMMAMIGFIMISAAGFAAVMKQTGAVETLVQSLAMITANNKLFAAFGMLLVGLLITMGIGSSFSTIPILATVYVPLALSLDFSPLATVSLLGTAAALGDAGSPASDSTLGPTSGLNSDGQHEHILDSVIPTFLHYNIPLLICGLLAAMIL